MRPVICMVTDGRCPPDGDDALVERIHRAARAGLSLVQVREPQLDPSALTRIVSRAVEAARGTRTRILVNDRIDVALAAGAHGVHLPSDAPPASRVRRLVGAGCLLGRAVHTQPEVEAADEDAAADFVVFGTVFRTPSKPGITSAGLPALARAAAGRLPVLAIGGVTLETLPDVARTGASGFAAIRLFTDAPLNALPDVIEAAVRAFDTVRGPSLP